MSKYSVKLKSVHFFSILWNNLVFSFLINTNPSPHSYFVQTILIFRVSSGCSGRFYNKGCVRSFEEQWPHFEIKAVWWIRSCAVLIVVHTVCLTVMCICHHRWNRDVSDAVGTVTSTVLSLSVPQHQAASLPPTVEPHVDFLE